MNVDQHHPKPTSAATERRPEAGLAVFLWLLVVLAAEVEAILWLFERAYT